jgi:hypothetical protein
MSAALRSASLASGLKPRTKENGRLAFMATNGGNGVRGLRKHNPTAPHGKDGAMPG